jgi:hypothetical protein
VPRDDVAAVFAELVHAPEVTREILELTGGDTPIRAAVSAAGRGWRGAAAPGVFPRPDTANEPHALQQERP